MLEDIRLCCSDIKEYTAGFDAQTWIDTRLVRRAVERNLEIMGEACVRLRNTDPQTASRIKDLPNVIGLRTRLAHGYDTEVDSFQLWETITVSVPRLEEAVTVLLKDVE